jgi:glycogen debranching enzyme
LSSTVREDNALLAVNLTNPDLSADGRVVVPRGVLHVFRTAFLWDGACYQELRVTNYSLTEQEAELVLRFEADFADIFEVRGTRRERRGELVPPEALDGTVTLSYRGLDGAERRTRILF